MRRQRLAGIDTPFNSPGACACAATILQRLFSQKLLISAAFARLSPLLTISPERSSSSQLRACCGFPFSPDQPVRRPGQPLSGALPSFNRAGDGGGNAGRFLPVGTEPSRLALNQISVIRASRFSQRLRPVPRGPDLVTSGKMQKREAVAMIRASDLHLSKPRAGIGMLEPRRCRNDLTVLD